MLSLIYGFDATTLFSQGFNDPSLKTLLKLFSGLTMLLPFGKTFVINFLKGISSVFMIFKVILYVFNRDPRYFNIFHSVNLYLGKIDTYRPTHDCTCIIPCTCDTITNLRKFRDQDKVLKFLKGLNEQFSHVHYQIMMIEPLPNLDRAFSVVLGQETKLTTPLTQPSVFEPQTLDSQIQPQHGYGRSSSYSSSRGRGHNYHTHDHG